MREVLIIFILCVCLMSAMRSCEMYALDTYDKFPDYDLIGDPSEDVICYENTTPEACADICDTESGCMGFKHSTKDNACCLSGYLLPENKHAPGYQITSYIKIPPGYKIEQKGDRLGGEIKILEEVGLDGCAKECDSDKECVGFSLQGASCIPKKNEGLLPKYIENTRAQFYVKNAQV